MTDARKRDRDNADVLDKDDLPSGNSIVQAAYSAGLFSDQGDKDGEPVSDEPSQSSH